MVFILFVVDTCLFMMVNVFFIIYIFFILMMLFLLIFHLFLIIYLAYYSLIFVIACPSYSAD